MLFRCFVGLAIDAPVWDVTVFTKNSERLLAGDVAVSFLLTIMGDPASQRLLSTEHFSVDGALIDAWASMKSFRRKDGQDDPPSEPGHNAERDFRGEARSSKTHASTTDPDAPGDLGPGTVQAGSVNCSVRGGVAKPAERALQSPNAAACIGSDVFEADWNISMGGKISLSVAR